MTFRKAFTFASMSVLAIIMAYPFIFMIEQSFKSKAQFLGEPGHSFVSWEKLFTIMPVGRQLLNSILVCSGAIAIILVLSTLAGFGLAK